MANLLEENLAVSQRWIKNISKYKIQILAGHVNQSFSEDPTLKWKKLEEKSNFLILKISQKILWEDGEVFEEEVKEAPQKPAEQSFSGHISESGLPLKKSEGLSDSDEE